MLTDEQQIFDQIEKANNILITFKEDYDGDAISSALALYLFLKKLNKNVSIINANFQKPKLFSFLPSISVVQPKLNTTKQFIISLDTSRASATDISYEANGNKLNFMITPQEGQFTPADVSSGMVGDDYDLIIILATPDLELLNGIYNHNTEFFYNTPVINIDHHPHNEEFGQINYVQITALATAEILFLLLHNHSAEIINSDIATCLLTGIITESKSFKIGSLTPNSLTIASDLVNLGARREEIIHHLYQSRDINTLKLWGRVLAKLQQTLDGRFVWSSLNEADFSKTNSQPDDIDNVIEELIVNVPEAEVIALFTGSDNHKSTAQIYTFKNIDIRNLMREFKENNLTTKINSKNHAIITSDKPLVEFETKIIEHLKSKLSKLTL